MPKLNFIPIQLPAAQPDCCVECPLCGLVPNHLRPKGSLETHVCMGTMEAMNGRAVKVRASQRDKKHPWHRVCDNRWEAWVSLPERKFGVPTKTYTLCRVPFEMSLQFQIKFHK